MQDLTQMPLKVQTVQQVQYSKYSTASTGFAVLYLLYLRAVLGWTGLGWAMLGWALLGWAVLYCTVLYLPMVLNILDLSTLLTDCTCVLCLLTAALTCSVTAKKGSHRSRVACAR